MSGEDATPALRLIGADEPSASRFLRETPEMRAVAAANRASADAADALTDTDARLLFARRVSDALEGGRAAILPAPRRDNLRKLAVRLGMTDFDASLVTAIVQDAARRGEEIESDPVKGRLSLVRPARKAVSNDLVMRVAASLLLGAMLLIALVRWVVR